MLSDKLMHGLILYLNNPKHGNTSAWRSYPKKASEIRDSRVQLLFGKTYCVCMCIYTHIYINNIYICRYRYRYICASYVSYLSVHELFPHVCGLNPTTRWQTKRYWISSPRTGSWRKVAVLSTKIIGISITKILRSRPGG